MSVTRTKPQRTLRVLSALTARLVVVAVDEGKRHDEYTVSSHDGAVWVSHTADAGRKYRVDCAAGRPAACDCPTNPNKAVCRHIALSAVLIGRGELELPTAN